MKSKIYRAGMLPYIVEDGVIRFLFMRPADPRFGGAEFQIAKGKVEDGENFLQAAIREASEELGLLPENCVNIMKLGDYLGRTAMFLAEVRDKHRFGVPHFETGETAWLSAGEFKTVGRSLHIPIVNDAYCLLTDYQIV
jgi:8-oxo-dGTP pyrophosphatase MutT (NUDIX family)